MQCPPCAHPDSIRYGTSRGVQRYRCQACQRIFQTLQRGKDPALKQQACQPYLDGMGMRAVGRVLGIHHKTLLLAAASCPSTPSEPIADRGLLLHRSRSALSSLKKSQCWLWIAVDSIFGKVQRLCLWKKDDQNR